MDSYNSKMKKRDFNFFESNENEPYVETNVLIRQEAEFLAKQFKFEDEIEDGYENSSSIFAIQEDKNEHTLEMFKNAIKDIVPSNDILYSFQNSMDDTINKLNDIVTILKFDTQNQIEKNKVETTIENNQPIVSQEELLESFQKILDLRMDETNYQIQNNVEELNSTKEKFNDMLLKYENQLSDILEKQRTFDAYFENNQSSLGKLIVDLNKAKENYNNIELEIEKIYSIWTQNNKLLEKLENIIHDITHSKLGYEEDMNSLLDEIKDRTISNQNSISNFSNQLNNLKEKMFSVNKNYEGLASLHDQNIDLIKETIKNNENKFNSFQDEIYKEIKRIDDDNDANFAELREKEYSTIERIVNLETQVDKNKTQINDLASKLEEINQIEKIVDSVLSATVFQKSLETKIENMIIENNNYIGDELRHKLDSFSTNVVSDVDDMRKISNDIIEKYQTIDNKILELYNDFHNVDNREEIKKTLESIEKNYNLLHETTSSKINENLLTIESKLNDFSVSENDILEVFNSSHELTTIIRDKIRQVIQEKVDDVSFNLEEIQASLESKIKDFNEKILASSLDEKIQTEAIKIKNETLNILYRELITRDNKIDFNSEELVKNYHGLLECNRILKNLEELIIRQAEEFDGYKSDETNSISLIVDKISEQKLKISELEESIRKNISDFNLYSDSESSQAMRRGLDAWRLEFSSDIIHMVKNLVEEEIKKQNFISYVDKKVQKYDDNNNEFCLLSSENFEKQNQKNNFFVERVKDILNRLENSDLQKTFEQTFNLNIDINDLKKDEENHVEDDNLEWFYEKEYQEYVSQRKKGGN